MSKEDFLAVRRAPKGRAGVFDVEALLMRDLKGVDKKKKSTPASAESNFLDAANLIFADSMPADLMPQIFTAIKVLHHWEDLEPRILAIAARLVILYQSGPDQNGVPPSTYLTPRVFDQNPAIAAWISKINETATPEIIAGYRADVLAYYRMFFIR